MQIGVSMPRTPDGPALKEFAQAADAMGFESVLIGDHIVLPTGGTTQYPYSTSGSFSRPSDEPYLETMTLLGYLAACTERIKIGSTVVILPYRNPVVQAKMFASLDSLTGGRMICGIGVGWLEKEFETLGVSYAERGPLTDEFLEIFRTLWYDDDPEHHGKHYDFDGIQFYPKPVQNPLPIWVGGATRAALRRTAKYGDCWHPSRQTPEFVASQLPYLRRRIEREGRKVEDVTVSLKRAVHFTDIGLPEAGGERTGGALVCSTQEVVDDLHACHEIGIHQLTYDFRVDEIPDCIRVMERLAEAVLPVAARLG